jgi:hypothetical protein
MSMIARLFGVLIGACLVCAPLHAEQLRQYSLGDHGTIEVALPDEWRDEVRVLSQELPPLISFQGAGALKFTGRFSAIWPQREGVKLLNTEQLKEVLEQAAQAARQRSDGTEVKLRELRGDQARGWYFTATDRDPGPKGYKYLLQAAFVLPGVTVQVSLLTNDPPMKLHQQALAMLRKVKLQPVKTNATEKG